VYASAVLGVLAVKALATDEQQRILLPQLATGSMRLSPAITEVDYGWTPEQVRATLHRDGSDYVLEGTKVFVPDAAGATHLLVAARMKDGDGDGNVVFAVVDAASTGIARRRLPGLMDWQSEVVFSHVRLGPEYLLGTNLSDRWQAFSNSLETAIPIMTSYQVGSCQTVFDMSVAYSNSRVQFGRPIGQFQRVQDHIIDLVNHLDAARWTTYEALSKLDKGDSARSSVHLAKAVTAEAHWEACNLAHEVHAGLGSDTQFGLAKHTYVSRSLYAFLGDPHWHRQELARVLGW
jgi:alkylation response protein AidB-like acyl-CoA dehydrogenase